jgi:hypothetical protein
VSSKTWISALLFVPIVTMGGGALAAEADEAALHHVFFGTGRGVVRAKDVKKTHEAYMEAMIRDGDCAQVSVPGQPFEAKCGPKEELLKSAAFDGGYLMSNTGGGRVCEDVLSWWKTSVSPRVQRKLPTLAVVYAGFKETDPSCSELAKTLEADLAAKPSLVVWPELDGAIIPRSMRDLAKRAPSRVRLVKLRDLREAGSARWDVGTFVVDTADPDTESTGLWPGRKANVVWLRAPVRHEGWRPIRVRFAAQARSPHLQPQLSTTFIASRTVVGATQRWWLPDTTTGDLRVKMLVRLMPATLGVTRPKVVVIDVSPSVDYPGSQAQGSFPVNLQTGYFPVVPRGAAQRVIEFDARAGIGKETDVHRFCTLEPGAEVRRGALFMSHVRWSARALELRGATPEETDGFRRAVTEGKSLVSQVTSSRTNAAHRVADLHWKRPTVPMCGDPPLSVLARIEESNGWVDPRVCEACSARISIRGDDCEGWGPLPWALLAALAVMIGMAFASKNTARGRR